MIEWLRERIKAKSDVEVPNIVPHERAMTNEASPPPTSALLSVLRRNSVAKPKDK